MSGTTDRQQATRNGRPWAVAWPDTAKKDFAKNKGLRQEPPARSGVCTTGPVGPHIQ